MESFDQSAVGRKKDMEAQLKKTTMVKESKARQRNAWGAGNSVSGNSCGAVQGRPLAKNVCHSIT